MDAIFIVVAVCLVQFIAVQLTLRHYFPPDT
jgi:hypothetical protein